MGLAKFAFLVCRSHRETDHQLLSGCREDVLRKVKGAWKVGQNPHQLDLLSTRSGRSLGLTTSAGSTPEPDQVPLPRRFRLECRSARPSVSGRY